jgi:hypothetical protein
VGEPQVQTPVLPKKEKGRKKKLGKVFMCACGEKERRGGIYYKKLNYVPKLCNQQAGDQKN